MFLTRIQLNPRRRESIKLFASPQVMHAAVLAGFPGEISTDAGRVLWRVDQLGEHRYLLVVSPEKPDFTHLVEQAGWPSTGTGWQTRDYTDRLDRLEAGQIWGFRLLANPVVAMAPEPGSKRGKIIGIASPGRQLDWLHDNANRNGFSLISQQVERIDAESGGTVLIGELGTRVSKAQQVRFARGRSQVTLQQATFDGLLEITDPALFRVALSHGLGRARGYGCGLLTIAPVR